MWFELLSRLDFERTVPRAADLWGADPGSLEYVGTSANVVFRFRRRGGACYLRMLHTSLRPRRTIEETVDFLRHLHRSGAQVCRPLDSDRGRGVECVGQGDDVYAAVAVEAAPGESLRAERCDRAALEAAGASIASVHNAAESFEPADRAHFLDFRDHWRNSAEAVPEDDRLAARERRELDEWLGGLPSPETPGVFGLTHADCNIGNLVYDGSSVLTIDFDEPVYHYWAADLARPLRDFLDRGRAERREVLRTLVAGYRSLRPLEERWVEWLPGFVRVKGFEIYSWAQRVENRGAERLPGSNRPDELLRELRREMEEPLDW